jgi:hypothetical protein
MYYLVENTETVCLLLRSLSEERKSNRESGERGKVCKRSYVVAHGGSESRTVFTFYFYL